MKIKLILGAVVTALLLLSGSVTADEKMKKDTQAPQLTDQNGMTLYVFDKDMKNTSNCYDGCEKKWPVFHGDLDKLMLPEGVSKADFGTITRKNGAMQTTYKTKPLYYFFKDAKSNDVNGDGKKGVWHIVK